MASDLNNVPRDISESIRDVVDKKTRLTIRRLVHQDAIKEKEKPDKKVLAFSQYRVFVFTAKLPCRMEHSFNYLSIDSIESKTCGQLLLMAEGKTYLFHSLVDEDTDEFDHMIAHICTSLKNVFISTPLNKLIKTIDVSPPDRIKTMHTMIKDIEARDPGPCDNYSQMYSAMCDKHCLPYRDEVAWDVDTIYLSQGNKEFCVGDFDHLDPRELVPVIAALRFNKWFTKFNATNTKLNLAAMNEVNKVMKSNTVLEELHLAGVGLKWEFVHKLSMALLSNSETPLHTIDFSDNNIEDRGIIHLTNPLSKLTKGLVSINFARCGLTAKGINRLADSLAMNKYVASTLTKLDLSGNSLKMEELTSLCNFLAKPNTLRHIDLSETECPLDMVCGALLRGCTQNLSHLNLGGNVFTSRAKSKEITVPVTWKQFFSTAMSLQYLNLSNNKLPPEALRGLLNGLTSNLQIEDMTLDISTNDFRTAGALILENSIANLTCVSRLDISDNGLDIDMIPILNRVTENKNLRELSIGKNFVTTKSKLMFWLPADSFNKGLHQQRKNVAQVLDAVMHLIQDDCCPITSLSLADSKLKMDTAIIINAIGSNTSLLKLDISGNYMGDVGARMLAKALVINHKLETVLWDRNLTTHQGFKDVANALESNYTLRYMPTPVYDAANALKNNSEKTLAVLEHIEALLHRNHSPRKFNSDKSFRLHQGFLVNSAQQMVDRLVVQLQDTINALGNDCSESTGSQIETAQKFLKDADSARQVLLSLQKVSQESEGKGNVVDQKLDNIGIEIQDLLSTQLKNNLEEMLRSVEEQCPAIMEDEAFKEEILNACAEKIKLQPNLVHDLLVEQVGTDLMNKMCEVNLALSEYLSNRIMDAVLESLTTNHRELKDHLNAKISSSQVNLRNAEADNNVFIINKDELEDECCGQKRRSIKISKVRPQSVIDCMETSLYEKSEHEIEEKNSTGHSASIDAPGPSLFVKAPEVKAVVLSPPTNKPKIKTTNDAEVFGDLSPLPAAGEQKLQHLQKSRPRRPRTHLPSKPAASREPTNNNDSNETDSPFTLSEGVNAFFETSSEPVNVPTVTPAVKRPPPPSNKPKTSTKKPSFLNNLTNRKEDTEKSDDKSKEKSESKSGFGFGKMKFFKKKNETKAEPEETKPEEKPDTEEKVEVQSEVTVEEPVVKRQPASIPKIGFGVNSGIFAEMKLKQTGMASEARTTWYCQFQGDKADQKHKPPPPRPDKSPQAPPRASRAFSASEKKPGPAPPPSTKPAPPSRPKPPIASAKPRKPPPPGSRLSKESSPVIASRESSRESTPQPASRDSTLSKDLRTIATKESRPSSSESSPAENRKDSSLEKDENRLSVKNRIDSLRRLSGTDSDTENTNKSQSLPRGMTPIDITDGSDSMKSSNSLTNITPSLPVVAVSVETNIPTESTEEPSAVKEIPEEVSQDTEQKKETSDDDDDDDDNSSSSDVNSAGAEFDLQNDAGSADVTENNNKPIDIEVESDEQVKIPVADCVLLDDGDDGDTCDV
ncbi:F-actin-uncapping protein LRRC16A-like isoform X2 [Tubulanus polymorphus]|uniref:F-actin-uncapping protein LRRC16A-like isoform X2 n=1 Tax=Tubulanus polymorphus TaxID=672921 RepID=UPI003DA6C484